MGLDSRALPDSSPLLLVLCPTPRTLYGSDHLGQVHLALGRSVCVGSAHRIANIGSVLASLWSYTHIALLAAVVRWRWVRALVLR